MSVLFFNLLFMLRSIIEPKEKSDWTGWDLEATLSGLRDPSWATREAFQKAFADFPDPRAEGAKNLVIWAIAEMDWHALTPEIREALIRARTHIEQ